MVSDNGAVREDTPCAKLDFFLKPFSDMTKAQVSYSEGENARIMGGPPFWCLPLVPPLPPAVWFTNCNPCAIGGAPHVIQSSLEVSSRRFARQNM